MKSFAALLVLCGLVPVLVSGCSSVGGSAPRVVDNSESVTRVGRVDIQDWDAAASEISQLVLECGAIKSPPDRPAILMVSKFRNDTQDFNLPIGVLTDKITDKFNASGKAQGMTDDPAAREIMKKNNLLGKGPKPPDPDYTLTGSVTQIRAKEGRTNQSTFIFHLKLNDTHTGTSVWQGEKQITKQGTRAGVGL